jgi:hypothetical protein
VRARRPISITLAIFALGTGALAGCGSDDALSDKAKKELGRQGAPGLPGSSTSTAPAGPVGPITGP